jgi:type IV pilus assembly protein PilC
MRTNAYKYVAWDAARKRHEAVKEGSTREDVLAWLRSNGLTPISVDLVQATKTQSRRMPKYRKVKSADLSTFCWQVGTMINGGMPITTAIETVAEDVDNKYFEAVLVRIAEDLQRGNSLHESLEQFPKVFNTLSRAMIMAGEIGGSLTTSLERLAEYYESRDKLLRKIKGATAYPIFVVCFIVLIIVALMTFIVPRFMVMFDQMKGDLPAFTKGFMVVYYAIMNNGVTIVATAVGSVASLIAFSRTQFGHAILSRVAIKLPMFGNIIRQAFVATFCKTLSTLSTSGVSILDSMDIITRLTSNNVLKDAVVRMEGRVREGVGISASMEETDIFSGVAVKMAKVGEESGSLSEVLDKASEFYEKKMEGAISLMLGLLEPALIVIVGGIVLVVILAMYLPIFSMSDM